MSDGNKFNLKVVENIGTIKVKSKQYFRQRVLREITQQMEMFK